MSVALPSELDFSLPASLPDNKSYEIRTQATNGASFVSTTGGAVIQMSLPLLQRSFYESNTMYLTGRITVTSSLAAGAAAATDIFLNPAGIYGAFSRLTVRAANGNTLDDIQQPGYVANMLLKAGLTFAERISCSNTMLLGDSPNNLGLSFNLANTPGRVKTLDFCMPMIGLLNMTKYLPAYGTELIIELTLASVTAFAPVVNGASATVDSMTFTNLELVSQVLEFSPSAFQIVQAQYPDKIVLKSETYSFGSSTIAGATTGTVDIPFNIRVNSLKRLLMACSPSTVIEGVGYGSVCPNANGIQFVSNGIQYPQRAVQCSRPAEVYGQFQKAFGGLYSADKTGSITINGFRRASTAYVPEVYGAFTPAPTAVTVNKGADALAAPNSWYFILDLEALSNHKESLYNGVNTTGSSANYVRIDISTALAAVPHTVSYFSCHDVLLNIDLVSGIVSTVV
ncbi:MAG: hypothetical protein ACOVOV_13740 [Dolichospermum sp.]